MKKILPKILKYIVLLFFAVLILFPIYMIIVGSLKTDMELYNNIFGLPSHLEFSNFVTAFESGKMAIYFKNSLIVTVVSVVLLIILGSMSAFALTRLRLKHGNKIYALFVIGLAVPTQVGIIQLALLMSKMKLMNSLIGLILAYVAYELPFSVFVFYGLMQSLPWEIQEASIMDGCNVFQQYSRIAMPLSKSAIVTVTIFDMVIIWNDMLFPMVLTSKENLRTLPFGLLQFRGQHASQYTVIFAGILIISLPLIILYFLMQKQFMTGMVDGAVKG